MKRLNSNAKKWKEYENAKQWMKIEAGKREEVEVSSFGSIWKWKTLPKTNDKWTHRRTNDKLKPFQHESYYLSK